MLALLPEEQQWLTAYRKALDARYPGTVERIAVFGSKVRGEATDDSDLDVLVLVRGADDRMQQREMRNLGHDLATELYLAGDDPNAVVVASIMVYSTSAWETSKRQGFAFQTTVEREAVAV